MYKFNFHAGKENGLFKRYTQLQADGIEAIIRECNKQGLCKNQIAYVLATAYHEGFDYDGKSTGTKQRLVPIKEKGGEAYLKSKKYYPFYGRGYVQLTWEDNYEKYSEILGVDLVKFPDLALDLDTAAFILVHGMRTGAYTGKRLSDYITNNKTDFLAARRIVNGTDRAKDIAGYAQRFSYCIY